MQFENCAFPWKLLAFPIQFSSAFPEIPVPCRKFEINCVKPWKFSKGLFLLGGIQSEMKQSLTDFSNIICFFSIVIRPTVEEKI